MTLVAKVENGSVKLYDANSGMMRRTIGYNAVSAVVNGSTVSVTKTDGRVEIYDANSGMLQRTI